MKPQKMSFREILKIDKLKGIEKGYYCIECNPNGLCLGYCSKHSTSGKAYAINPI